MAQFGFGQDDEGYDARFDLDGDGMIGFGDFSDFLPMLLAKLYSRIDCVTSILQDKVSIVNGLKMYLFITGATNKGFRRVLL